MTPDNLAVGYAVIGIIFFVIAFFYDLKMLKVPVAETGDNEFIDMLICLLILSIAWPFSITMSLLLWYYDKDKK